ncbi:MAG: hypothetical protein LLF76_07750 [Planctomycetaceae bacterium]|nr:hypothetical protein [Planctomycetaceae bacterium]
MRDITNVKLLYMKGLLFVLLGLMASIILLIERPTLKTAVLLFIAIWAFARAYYFAFYVIEHYVDSSYKFAGLSSFIGYLCERKKKE